MLHFKIKILQFDLHTIWKQQFLLQKSKINQC